MADEPKDTNEGALDAEVVAIDLDGQTDDLEAAMREAVAAVEGVEAEARSEKQDAGGADGSTAGDADESELERLRRENADLRERSVRTLADFDNYRKRSERERQDIRRYAVVEPLRELLGVMDNLELALSAGGSAEDLKRGVEMIHRQMQDLLRRLGAKEVPAVGQPFDPAVHEAVAREEDPTVKSATVKEELRRGYTIHDRLLRPSMVKVAMPGTPPAGNA
ncbi:MAG TPA: nucleotide exchange factor GrpE [Thermoanaerobaculia bacterium]|nr:nucleotide exchange factor GrpE [Thermoanaerobaculia bacterium]